MKQSIWIWGGRGKSQWEQLIRLAGAVALLLATQLTYAQKVDMTLAADPAGSTAMQPIGDEPPIDRDKADFQTLNDGLTSVEDLFSGGGTEAVVFDIETAKLRGTDEAVIRLAEELTAYTNDLIRAAAAFESGGSVHPMEVVPTEKYLMVQTFFRAANVFHLDEARRSRDEGRSVEAQSGCPWYLGKAACTCGHWQYPRPTKAAAWVTHKSSNPAATLRNWGYHESAAAAGSGWTRAQSYSPSVCGSGTFRDHAIINRDNKSFREQSYAGWTPRGEPNPEFWKSWVWPYPLWPSYVSWWHLSYTP